MRDSTVLFTRFSLIEWIRGFFFVISFACPVIDCSFCVALKFFDLIREVVVSQAQDRSSFKILHYNGLLFSKQLNHTHTHFDKFTQVDPRFALHDENSSSRVNQTEMNWSWVEPGLKSVV